MSVYIFADGEDEGLVASTLGLCEAADYVAARVKPDSEIRKFFDEGGTLNASQCAAELSDLLPDAPKAIRTVLSLMCKAMKNKSDAFLTDGEIVDEDESEIGNTEKALAPTSKRQVAPKKAARTQKRRKSGKE